MSLYCRGCIIFTIMFLSLSFSYYLSSFSLFGNFNYLLDFLCLFLYHFLSNSFQLSKNFFFCYSVDLICVSSNFALFLWFFFSSSLLVSTSSCFISSHCLPSPSWVLTFLSSILVIYWNAWGKYATWTLTMKQIIFMGRGGHAKYLMVYVPCYVSGDLC